MPAPHFDSDDKRSSQTWIGQGDSEQSRQPYPSSDNNKERSSVSIDGKSFEEISWQKKAKPTERMTTVQRTYTVQNSMRNRSIGDDHLRHEGSHNCNAPTRPMMSSILLPGGADRTM